MNALWVLLAIAVAGAIVALAMSWLRRDEDSDLGTVSHQWIAEQRLGQGQDSRR